MIKNAKIFRAPGEGLLTFTTGSGRAAKAMMPYVGSKAYQAWSESLALQFKSWNPYERPFSVIGIPSDSGGGICRGAAHGPLALREAYYAKNPADARFDLGDVPCIPHLLYDDMLSVEQRKKSGRSLWGQSYRLSQPVSPLNILEEFLVEAWSTLPGFRPLILGGDHSISYPVFAALKRTGLLQDIAILHFDAHTDLLESRFGVDVCFGTWSSHLAKWLKRPENYVQVGVRTSGKTKAYWEKKYGIHQYWSKEVSSLDPKTFSKKLLAQWKKQNCKMLYITNDIDGTDLSEAPATGTPESKGLKSRWVEEVIRHCSLELPLIGADLVEVAPVLGSKKEQQLTLQTAVRQLEALQW